MGRLRSRPTTAAAKPLRASRVSWVDVRPVCPTSGAISTPASAASMKPSAQPICAMRWGLAPAMATSSGSSTTARSATPRRKRRRKTPSRTATTAATTTIMICWSWIVTPLAPKRCTDSDGAVGGGEVGRHGADDIRAAPEDRGHAEQDHEQSKRHHQRSLDRGAVDAPEQHELHCDGQERRLDEHDDRNGEEERPVPVLPQLPVREGRHHPHRALGEVEDARRVVGDHQARGQDAVDGARTRCPRTVKERKTLTASLPCPPPDVPIARGP